MTLPNLAEVKIFFSDRENRKKLVVSFAVGLVIVVGGFLLVNRISKVRPGRNGAVSTGNGENGISVTPSPPASLSPIEQLGESVEKYETNLGEIGKFDLELYPPDLQIKVSF